MATPTHRAVIQTGIKNEGKEDEKKFFADIGVAWAVDTANGIVMNIDFDAIPTKTSKVTLFPITEKKKS